LNNFLTMKTSHYPSLELCKKLTEIGFPETYSRWYWNCENSYSIWAQHPRPKDWEHPEIPCPSVMEMLDVIPDNIHIWQHQYSWRMSPYSLAYIPNQSHEQWDSLIIPITQWIPNALAEMILWLHENKYISLSTSSTLT